MSNTDCLRYGGAYCKLDYEKQSSFKIKVEVTDNGTPAMSSTFDATVQLQDINDQPRSLSLSATVVSGDKKAFYLFTTSSQLSLLLGCFLISILLNLDCISLGRFSLSLTIILPV